MMLVRIVPIQNFPLIKPGDDVAGLLIKHIEMLKEVPLQNSVLVVTHKIISRAEGRLFPKSEIEVNQRASQIAARLQRDPVQVALALQEADTVIREEPVLITRTHHGIITDFSAVDESNVPLDHLVTLPLDPDRSARDIHERIRERLHAYIPVIISDTQGRPWRKGAVNVAIGIGGMSPFIANRGRKDLYGRMLHSSLVCLADELAATAELVMGQADERIPAALICDVKFEISPGSAKQILRDDSSNLFQ